MASKWEAQARIDKAVLALLQLLGSEGAEFDSIFAVTKASHRTELSRSLQRLIGEGLVTQVHAVKAASVSRYVWVVPPALRSRGAD